MKITSIKQQVKLKDRYSVFVDGTYCFSLSESAFLQSGIVNGLEISAEELEQFKELSRDDKIYGKILRYISIRSRSKWEIVDYLRRKEVDETTSTKILAKLEKLGLIDDRAFAQIWVDNRRLLKNTSRRKISLELKQKHVPPEIIDAVLAEDKLDVDEREVIRQLAERKLTRYPDRQKLMQYLARQGFSYEDIKSVVTDLVV